MSRKDFHVFTNLASSIDGKITTKDRAHIDPSRHDRLMMDLLRSRAHALLMGATTLRVFKKPCLIEARRLRLLRKAKRMNPHPINAVIATQIDFEPSWPFFKTEDVERVLFVPQGTAEESLEPFRSLCHISRFEVSKPAPQQIIQYLKGLECKNLLIEGGGETLFSWAEQDLIDEWNVTLVPKIIGGREAPTMVEGEGFDVTAIKTYRLASSKRKGDELYLKYLRKR